MKRKPKKVRVRKGPNILAREKVKKQLLVIKTALKRTIVATQHAAFSIEEFGKVLGVSRAVDDIIAKLGV